MKSGHPLPTVDPSKASHPKPSLGFTPNALHKAAYGHFTQEKFLREGHNTTYTSFRKKPGVTVRRNVDRLSRRQAKRQIRAGNEAVAAERPVLAAKVAKRASIKAAVASGVSRKVARKTSRGGVRSARQSTESARSERKLGKPNRKARTTSSY